MKPIEKVLSPEGSPPPSMAKGRPGLRVCLAGSGGGHVRQLLDLETVWSKYDHFIVSEVSALSRSLASSHPVFFVSHFAYGQAKLGTPFRMLADCPTAKQTILSLGTPSSLQIRNCCWQRQGLQFPYSRFCCL